MHKTRPILPPKNTNPANKLFKFEINIFLIISFNFQKKHISHNMNFSKLILPKYKTNGPYLFRCVKWIIVDIILAKFFII